MSDQRNCISCGMPLPRAKSEDKPKDYCEHCSGPDGSLKSYEEVLAGMSAFLVRTDGLSAGDAEAQAKLQLAQMPAWKASG